MVNKIKRSGTEGVALQITRPARSAALVEEDADGNPVYRADVLVYAFDHLLLVIDTDRVQIAHRAELVASAARDTESIHRAMEAAVQIAGNGYQVQLPPARDAGFSEGDRAPCQTAPGMLVVTKQDGTSAGADAVRLGRDLVTIRNDQIG
jgi:RNA polymerase subunit RPABC4/transcription elongation factor Spt4